jgi:hypothetical protein
MRTDKTSVFSSLSDHYSDFVHERVKLFKKLPSSAVISDAVLRNKFSISFEINVISCIYVQVTMSKGMSEGRYFSGPVFWKQWSRHLSASVGNATKCINPSARCLHEVLC